VAEKTLPEPDEVVVDEPVDETVVAPDETVTPEPEPEAPAPEPSQAEVDPGPSQTHNHVAIRDFMARFDHQVLSFVKDEVIDPRVGHGLRKQGAPIKLVEKPIEETKDAQ